MKVKTSITLSEDLLGAVDRLAKPSGSRSGVIERVLRAYFRRRERRLRDERELERINRAADRLNAEALDTLDYQTLP
jgi:metal-responsive CopG/Arc/MetJ family transcriptional regulator